jgi:hypothetical protein
VVVVDREQRRDLELRHQSGSAAMLVNGLCDTAGADRRPDVLVRQLVLGLRDRKVWSRTRCRLNGPRLHAHADGRTDAEVGRSAWRIESYVVRGEHCVWDLLYVAEPSAFEPRAATSGARRELVTTRRWTPNCDAR